MRQIFIERIPFFEAQFTSDDVIFSLFITFDDNIFDNAFIDFDRQRSVRRHLHIGNGGQNITLLYVEIFNRANFFAHFHRIQNAALRNGQHLRKVLGIKRRHAFHADLIDHRVRRDLIRQLHAFRHGGENRRDLRKDAAVANGFDVGRDRFRRYFVADFGSQTRQYLLCDSVRNACQRYFCNRFADLRINRRLIRFGYIQSLHIARLGRLADGQRRIVDQSLRRKRVFCARCHRR